MSAPGNLTNKAAYLDYPTALMDGWPIATGTIEGACRHIVKDRMDLTCAPWSLEGAEAVLKLRVVRSNGDLDDYWRFHLSQEYERVHRSRYANNVVPWLHDLLEGSRIQLLVLQARLSLRKFAPVRRRRR
jgi:hypothetical protein